MVTLTIVCLLALIGLVAYGVWLAGELGVGPGLFPSRRAKKPEDEQVPERPRTADEH